MNERNGMPPSDQELAALADGTIAPERRREIENQLASSEAIRESIDRQRAAIDLTREVEVPAPDALHMRVAAMTADRAPSRRRPALVLGGSLAAAAVIALIAVFVVAPGSSPTAPNVDQVVTASAAGALMPAPKEDPANPGKLALGVGGVQFPYWEDDHGWRATGARSENVGGRPVNTVYYERSGGASIKYSIVSGAPIDTLASPTAYDITGSGDTRRIVWRNGGHTCIIEATGVSSGQLERMIA